MFGFNNYSDFLADHHDIRQFQNQVELKYLADQKEKKRKGLVAQDSIRCLLFLCVQLHSWPATLGHLLLARCVNPFYHMIHWSKLLFGSDSDSNQ